jgi:tRNA threonylcarbamoyladenosine biosynthesis protein TsaB
MVCAFETTSNWGSIAIRSGGVTLAEEHFESQGGFAHTIFGALEGILQRTQVSLTDIDCFAAANGPGAFTGVRVGLSLIQGLAEATTKPSCGVSNLRALAAAGHSPLRVVMIDARRGDTFCAVYDEHLQLVGSEHVGKLRDWLELLSQREYDLIASPDLDVSESLEQSRFAGATVIRAPRFLAAAVAECAEADGRVGRWSDPALLDANYVRRSDAEMFWKDN